MSIEKSYKKKLEQFNETHKYDTELEFLTGLIGRGGKRVLDYGCGTGYAVEKLQSFGLFVEGCDSKHHNEEFDYVSPISTFDVVYFMHSIAHIEHPKSILEQLRTKEVIVITPNRLWLNKQFDAKYKPDPTVVKHYTQGELIHLFLESGYEVLNVGQFGNITMDRNERVFLKARKL